MVSHTPGRAWAGSAGTSTGRRVRNNPSFSRPASRAAQAAVTSASLKRSCNRGARADRGTVPSSSSTAASTGSTARISLVCTS